MNPRAGLSQALLRGSNRRAFFAPAEGHDGSLGRGAMIRFEWQCGKTLEVLDERAGKQGKCPAFEQRNKGSTERDGEFDGTDTVCSGPRIH